jgi:anti-sigma regulatory factor (Ser/Thr protein kinase)
MPGQFSTPVIRGRAPSRNESVLVRVPADKDYVVLIRSAVGHLGAKLGCTVSEITDLRLAVNEACALLLEARRTDVAGESVGPGEQDALECRIGVRPDALEIVVTAPPGEAAPPEPGAFGWNILAALVDRLSWTLDADVARIELVKARVDPGAVPGAGGVDGVDGRPVAG